ncbi:Twitching motility protein PilT [Clostridiaceae bacterium JG1575]|nr:Twitching motility protein PilT [Clostridiaceae bacterium JG1575]
MEKELHELLASGRDQRATDLLLREEEAVYVRINDRLVQGQGVASKALMSWLFTRSIPGSSVSEGAKGLDVDQAYEWDGRCRMNLFTSQGKRCCCIRLLPQKVRSLKELGVCEALPARIHAHRGLCLLVGKTGSGKSTTLAALLTALTEEAPWHIITLEDPVEVVLTARQGLITQRELGRDFLSFEEGIRSALRQSPDLLMIGEIRDPISLRAALAAAESGTGVIATMHSLGAQGTLSRMLHMFSAAERDFVRFQIAATLNFLQSQILVPWNDGLKLDYELLLGTPAVSSIIRDGQFANLKNCILLGRRLGMKPFEEQVGASAVP